MQSYELELQRQRCKNLQRNEKHGTFLVELKNIFPSLKTL
jgi:hypothetical protein